MTIDKRPTKEEIDEYAERIDKAIQRGMFPESVYKYRCWNEDPEDDIIRKGILYLSPPSKLSEDYPEAILPIDESQLTDENLMKVARRDVAEFFPHLKGDEKEMKVDEIRSKMKAQDKNHLSEFEKYRLERNDEVYGIFCTSLTRDNSAQWEGTACLSTGFAVGLNLKEILIDERIFAQASKVKYYDLANPPKVPLFTFTQEESSKKAWDQVFNVPKLYQDEDELRILRHSHKYENGKIKAYEEDDRKIKLEDKHLTEIIIGSKMRDKDKVEFKEYCKLNFPKTKIVEQGK